MDTGSAPLESPFEHIALSLSGGGVRAVGYHLGTLDYLERVRLLPQVHTISSVSGGSLIAIGYALSLKKEEGFQRFFDNVFKFLPEMNTFEELLKVLRRPAPPVASRSRTLITALAQVYREAYFARYYGDPEFGIFWDDETEIHLKEIIFNATEFKTGIAFRFQKSEFRSIIGNGKVWLSEEHARRIRMSDIMAASSCIPGGMEPMMFPQDFHWPDDEIPTRGQGKRPYCDRVVEDLEKGFGISSVALMDGGVYDNQGISSVMLTLARKLRGAQGIGEPDEHDELAGQEPVLPRRWARWMLGGMGQASDTEDQKDLGDVDLFIVSDTPIRKDPMYETRGGAHAPRGRFVTWLRRRSLGWVNRWGWALTGILALSVATSIWRFFAEFGGTLGTSFSFDRESLVFLASSVVTLLLPALILMLAIFGLLRLGALANRLADSMVEEMPAMDADPWSYAKTLRLGQIWDMLSLRASSMSALAARIFMNRIRQLGYTLLYSHHEFERRVMDNNINDIRALTDDLPHDVPEFVQNPSENVLAIVDRAARMGTRLWIDKPQGDRHDLEVLVAAGHISTCFNVIEYLWQHQRNEAGQVIEKFVPLYEQARSDWIRLNEDPYLFLDERTEAGAERGSLYWNKTTRKSRRPFRMGWRKKSPAN